MRYAQIIAKALGRITDHPESHWQRVLVDGITSGRLDAALFLSEEPDDTAEAAINYAVEHKERILAPLEAGLRKAYENDV